MPGRGWGAEGQLALLICDAWRSIKGVVAIDCASVSGGNFLLLLRIKGVPYSLRCIQVFFFERGVI